MLTNPDGYPTGAQLEDLVGADRLLFDTLTPYFELDIGTSLIPYAPLH